MLIYITHISGSEADENNITDDTLKNQVAALTKTLSSLNETKNTLEQRFQNDKKVLLDQIQNLNNLIEVEMSKQQSLKLEYENAIQSLKNKLRHEQHEREQEQTHHVAMLREIQHMLGMLMSKIGEGVQPHFSPRHTEIWIWGWAKMGKNGKKVFEKRGKQTFYFQNRKNPHFFP